MHPISSNILSSNIQSFSQAIGTVSNLIKNRIFIAAAIAFTALAALYMLYRFRPQFCANIRSKLPETEPVPEIDKTASLSEKDLKLLADLLGDARIYDRLPTCTLTTQKQVTETESSESIVIDKIEEPVMKGTMPDGKGNELPFLLINIYNVSANFYEFFVFFFKNFNDPGCLEQNDGCLYQGTTATDGKLHIELPIIFPLQKYEPAKASASKHIDYQSNPINNADFLSHLLLHGKATQRFQPGVGKEEAHLLVNDFKKFQKLRAVYQPNCTTLVPNQNVGSPPAYAIG